MIEATTKSSPFKGCLKNHEIHENEISALMESWIAEGYTCVKRPVAKFQIARFEEWNENWFMRANLPTSSLKRAYRITCNFSRAYSFNFYLPGSVEGGGEEKNS